MLRQWTSAGVFPKAQGQIRSLTRRKAFSSLRALPTPKNKHHLQLLASVTPRSFQKTPHLPSTSTASLTSYSRALEDPPMAPSKRTPNRSTFKNEADTIERLLQHDEFRSWGLVIYRCTYTSGSDWDELMRRLRFCVTETLKQHNGLDLLGSFAPTVLEDARFDGASTSTVREHFKQWVVAACQEEQGVPWQDAQYAQSPRYRYCLMVDQEAMRSVLDAEMDELMWVDEGAYVRLIRREWPDSEDEDQDEELAGAPSVLDDSEPIEGCAMDDVGWMRVRADRAQIEAHVHMPDWRTQYRRPPEIAFQS
ncbi:uncharacterized protein DSM5745_06944 [Aspergillus mulundensis]|uniref:Muramidase n=1 Tax=Aspergillus mulundensis TaxID=1810919 RepID=A0A3D8RJS0_9EURO|nr:hypothetical protein DSM5745_06944 [Aspergillus mulundensis]RDW74282.1 hypothetical protein DSM5745_06944 [Aspergillus mulundensis]